MIQEWEKIAEAMGWKMVVATVDEFGVVNLAAEFIVDISEKSIIFCKFPESRTLDNIRTNPKGAAAIINWNTMKGFQFKGLMTQLRSYTPQKARAIKTYTEMLELGATQIVELSIAEVFDVVPKENQLDALFKGESFYSYFNKKIKYNQFKRPDYTTNSISQLKDRINNHLKSLLQNGFNSFVGTVENYGTPNISPRFVLEATDEFIFWGDKFKNKTFMNFSRPSPITVAMIDWNALKGYQAKGWGTFHFFGDTIVKVNEYWKKYGMKDPFQAVHFRVEELEEMTLGPSKKIWSENERRVWFGPSSYAAQKAETIPVSNLKITSDEKVQMPKTEHSENKLLIYGNSEFEKNLAGLIREHKQFFVQEMLPEHSESYFENLSKNFQHTSSVILSLISESKKVDSTMSSVNFLSNALSHIAAFKLPENQKNQARMILLLPEKTTQYLTTSINMIESFVSMNKIGISLVFLRLNPESPAAKSEKFAAFLQSIFEMKYLDRINHFRFSEN